MQLLSKAEIEKKKADDKKLQIEQGIILANKVDKLRELRLDEEKKYNLFYKETIGKYNKDISDLQVKKESLEQDIMSLEKTRERLKKPLDDEWDKLKVERAEFKRDLDDLERRKASVTDREEQVSKDSQVLIAAQDQVSDLYSKADQHYKDASLFRTKAKEELDTLQREHSLFVKERDTKMKLLEDKERQLDYDIEHNQTFKRNLKQKAKELKDRERRLAFYERQYAKLETRSE